MTTWFVVPARGGSKGLPGKNLLPVGGASLVARAVHAARMAIAEERLADARLLVDTDDPAIAAEARSWGAEVPFLREAALAGDRTSSVETMLGLLARLGDAVRDSDVLVLLQPTSPLRTADDIRACLGALGPGVASAATAARTTDAVDLALGVDDKRTLFWLAGETADGRRRQELRSTMHLTGAVYATTVRTLRETGRFVVSGVTRAVPMPRTRGIDVDSADDLATADVLARAQRTAPVVVAGRVIGNEAPCLVIAEAGVNHNGDPQLAHALVDAAAAAGADVVKFQTFDPEALAALDAPTAPYQAAAGAGRSQLDMLRGLTLPPSVWAELAEHARECGLLFLSTPFDAASADLLASLGVAAYKVPSGELTNLGFLADLARRGRPLLVSTGMATLAEVGDALVTIAAHGAPPVALFHCVSQYPAPLAEANLSALATLRATFGLPTGWSDHTPGALASLAAVAAGASMIEKHLTLYRGLPGPDHAASLEPEAFTELVRDLRAVESMRGDGIKRPAPSELAVMPVARRSLHAARDLAAGERLAEGDLVALRPGTGLPPRERERLLGRPLREPVARGAMLAEADVG